MKVPQMNFAICSAKRNGKFINHERNVVYTSRLQTKDFSEWDEQDFSSLFFKKLKMVINNMKTEIRNFLGYNCSFYKVAEENIEKAYLLIKNKASFIQVENALYNL